MLIEARQGQIKKKCHIAGVKNYFFHHISCPKYKYLWLSTGSIGCIFFVSGKVKTRCSTILDMKKHAVLRNLKAFVKENSHNDFYQSSLVLTV